MSRQGVGAGSPVSINGRFLAQHPSGVQRFARNLVIALDALLVTEPAALGGRTVRLVRPPGAPPLDGLSCIENVATGSGSGQWWEQVTLPRIARDGLLVSLGNTAPITARVQVVAMHDAAVWVHPEAFSASFGRWYRFLLPLLGRRAQRVITVSRFSADELARHAQVAPDRLRVVYNAADHMRGIAADTTVFTRIGVGARPFVLAVGNRTPQKNLSVLDDALERIGPTAYDVVHVGGANARVFGAGGASRSTRLRSVGFVSDAELRALYERALCLVFPSLYEGFGMPPLEAMTCGCPVLAARAASIPEVCGDAALYFDPRDTTDLARLLTRLTSDPVLRAQLADAGRTRARDYSWTASAATLAGVLREVLDAASPVPATAR